MRGTDKSGMDDVSINCRAVKGSMLQMLTKVKADQGGLAAETWVLDRHAKLQLGLLQIPWRY